MPSPGRLAGNREEGVTDSQRLGEFEGAETRKDHGERPGVSIAARRLPGAGGVEVGSPRWNLRAAAHAPMAAPSGARN